MTPWPNAAPRKACAGQARQEQRSSDDLINSRLQRGSAMPGGY